MGLYGSEEEVQRNLDYTLFWSGETETILMTSFRTKQAERVFYKSAINVKLRLFLLLILIVEN